MFQVTSNSPFKREGKQIKHLKCTYLSNYLNKMTQKKKLNWICNNTKENWLNNGQRGIDVNNITFEIHI
jgi:hypothetical protein